MDLDAIMNPEKITDKNKKTVCQLARTLGLFDEPNSDSFIHSTAHA